MQVLKVLFGLFLAIVTSLAITFIAFSAGVYVGEGQGSVLGHFLVFITPAVLAGLWFYRAGRSMGRAESADSITDLENEADELDSEADEMAAELEEVERECGYLRDTVHDLERELDFANGLLEPDTDSDTKAAEWMVAK